MGGHTDFAPDTESSARLSLRYCVRCGLGSSSSTRSNVKTSTLPLRRMHGGIDGAFGHPTILNHHGVSSGASNRKSAALMAREGYFEFSARYPLALTMRP